MEAALRPRMERHKLAPADCARSLACEERAISGNGQSTMSIQVRLLDHSHDPIRSLYIAYRTCYSSLTPLEIADRIEDERISAEQMLNFVEERLKTGHGSPLEQVWFEFLIAGVSRSFSHQFVRHRTGISFEQQSQRYVTFKRGTFPYTVPETIE